MLVIKFQCRQNMITPPAKMITRSESFPGGGITCVKASGVELSLIHQHCKNLRGKSTLNDEDEVTYVGDDARFIAANWEWIREQLYSKYTGKV